MGGYDLPLLFLLLLSFSRFFPFSMHVRNCQAYSELF